MTETLEVDVMFVIVIPFEFCYLSVHWNIFRS